MTSRFYRQNASRQFWAFVLILVIAAAAFASHSEAAVYTAKRPGFSILFQVKSDRILGIEARYTIHCRAKTGVLQNPKRHPQLSFDRRDSFRLGSKGRFSKRFKNVTDQVTVDRGIRGMVRGGKVRGRLLDKRFYSSPFTPQFCYSGRSNRKPWVKFVARRKHLPINGRG